MSNERPDDFFSWRSRLGAPDALPEQGLDDRELSWEKLAERLREKPRRRMTGYWVAAACLLLVLIPAARLFQLRQKPVANRQPVPQQVQPGRAGASPQQPAKEVAVWQKPEKKAVWWKPSENTPYLRSEPILERSGLRQNNSGRPRTSRSMQMPAARVHRSRAAQDSFLSRAEIARVVPDSQVLVSQLTNLAADSVHQPYKSLINKRLRIAHLNELDNANGWVPATTSRAREPELRALIYFKTH